MRRVICSAASGPHVDFLKATRPILAEYAKRHGYELVTVYSAPSPPRIPRWMADSSLVRRYDTILNRILLAAMKRMPLSEKALKHMLRSQIGAKAVDTTALWLLRAVAMAVTAATPPAWNKVSLVRRLLVDFDLVVWIDADAVIVDLSQDIARELQSDKWFHVVEHRFPNGEAHLNTGVFMVRANSTAHAFLGEVARLTPYRHHPWWEQAAMLHLMGYDLWPARQARSTSYSSGVALIDKSWNSIPLDQSEQPRIKHYAGLDNASRHRLISRDVAQVQKSLAEARADVRPG